MARIKEHCVDIAVGLVSQQRCQRVQSAKQSGWSDSKAAVQAEHRLILARQIVEMATIIDRRFLATSDPLLIVHILDVL